MEKAEDKKMIAEMKNFLSDKAKASYGGDDPKAEENLPFESIDSYSTDPVGFGEMSLRMLSKVEFVFDLAVKENRFDGNREEIRLQSVEAALTMLIHAIEQC